jgi:hypothetical protein
MAALTENNYDIEIRANRLSLRDVAALLGIPSAAQVKRAMDELDRLSLVEVAADVWERDPEITKLLALDKPMPDLLDHEACWEWADYATDAFLQFEHRYMRLPDGSPWLRPPFHRLWIKEILFAIASGGYLQILSPPRHGKTELLTHFVVWLIVRNPNVRIIWMGPNEPKAKEVVAKVKELLESHTQLIEETLAPGQSYAPKKRMGGVWQSNTFKVDCRTPGISGNTFIGVGRGAKILSLNADILVGDDLEDHDSTKSETSRKETRHWFETQFDSRKVEETAMFLIGSRQHIDDLYSYNIQDPNFRVLINKAHDDTCVLDEEDYQAHQDCMLFPALRSYRWLMSKKHGSENRAEEGEHGSYEMVYQNDPQEDTSYIFSEELLKASFNPGRRLGLDGIPADGRRLIAGLDPSGTGHQAAFLWALTPVDDVAGVTYLEAQDTRYKRWMVAYDNRIGGGIEEAIERMAEWLALYGVRHWVFEKNGFQELYLNDPRTRAWANRNDVTIEGEGTYQNKTDPVYGVSAMKRLWVAGLVDLPYLDEEAIRGTKLYTKQLKAHSDEKKVKGKTDIKMAAWFPTKRIRMWERELAVEKAKTKIRNDDVYPRSYENVSGFSGADNAPWSN